MKVSKMSNETYFQTFSTRSYHSNKFSHTIESATQNLFSCRSISRPRSDWKKHFCKFRRKGDWKKTGIGVRWIENCVIFERIFQNNKGILIFMKMKSYDHCRSKTRATFCWKIVLQKNKKWLFSEHLVHEVGNRPWLKQYKRDIQGKGKGNEMQRKDKFMRMLVSEFFKISSHSSKVSQISEWKTNWL